MVDMDDEGWMICGFSKLSPRVSIQRRWFPSHFSEPRAAATDESTEEQFLAAGQLR